MIERKKSIAPDTITMINLVWTTMIVAMLTATVTLYQEKSRVSDLSYRQMTGTYQDVFYN